MAGNGQVKDEFSDSLLSPASTIEVTPSSILSGRRTVTVAGTAVPVTAGSTPILGVVITALSTNTGLIYVGSASVTSSDGYQLRRNSSVFFAFDNLNDVYINSSVSGDGVTYLAVNT